MIRLDRQGAVDVASIGGRLDAEHLGEIAGGVAPLLHANARVVLDLGRVSVVDGVGLGWLLDVLEEATSFGGEVKLAAATALVTDVLAITGVGDRFDRHETVLEAVGGFAR